jgi:hypothetical protein
MISRSILGALALTLTAGWAGAVVPTGEIRSYDRNEDKLISGAEYTALARIKSRMSAEQRVTFEFGDPQAGVLVAKLIHTPIDLSCEPTQRFFLQRDIAGISLLLPNGIKQSNQGAKLNFSRDYVTGSSNWSVEGAVAWFAPIGGRCLTSDRKRNATGAVLSGFAIAPFLSFKGSGSSQARGTSNLSLGVLGQLQYFGGVFDHQTLSFSAAYQTDFRRDAEIYSVAATWKPYHLGYKINAVHNAARAKPTFGWWSLSANAEYLAVKSAGESGLQAGQDYAWIGLDAAYNVDFKSISNGAFAQFGVDLNHDVNNGIEANLAEVRVGLYLNADKRSSLALSYRKGRERSSLSKVDGITLNLNIAF